MIDKEIKLAPNGVEAYKLVVTEDTITFIDKTIKLLDVTNIHYGIRPLEFYKFYLGRTYFFEFQTKDDKLNITFKSYFGFANKYFYSLFDEIGKSIWTKIIVR